MLGIVIIPTDELIFFRGVETTNQINFVPYSKKTCPTFRMLHPMFRDIHLLPHPAFRWPLAMSSATVAPTVGGPKSFFGW